jgi:hypothetical protein
VNYQFVAQSAEDVQNIENAPAVRIGPYSIKSGQIQLLTTVSVYRLRGESREQIRMPSMNAEAIHVWEEMGREPKIIGEQVRPPPAAHRSPGICCPIFQVGEFRATVQEDVAYGTRSMAGLFAFWSGNWSSRTTLSSDLCTWMRPL